MKKLIVLFIAVAGFSLSSFAQVNATATSAATIITPISFGSITNMNFGNVAVNSSAGTVVLTSTNSRTPTGGVTLPVTTGTVAAASFVVNGAADYTFAITIPAVDAVTTIDDNAGHTMTVDNWSTPSATGTLTLGTATFAVGATLHVGATQAVGSYLSDIPFQVTVNYN